MTELNEKDWELINAYHDGELGKAERRAVERRLKAEPSLDAALNDIAGISRSLGSLRPAAPVQTDTPANDNRRSVIGLTAGILAATVAIAAMLGPRFLAEPSVFDLHGEFASQTYAVDGNDMRSVSALSDVNAPDLSAANLTPVTFKETEEGSIAHYAGLNGCRLSYFRGSFDQSREARANGEEIAAWSTDDGVGHMIVATGMDQQRFDAIASYLKLQTRQETTATVLAQLEGITTTAAPCIG